MAGEHKALPVMPKQPSRAPVPKKILSVNKLQLVWAQSRDATSKAGAPGVDGQRAKNFKANIEANLRRIAQQLTDGAFRFQPLKPRFIPKGADRWRVICVPTVRDRLVQRAIAEYLIENDKLRVVSEVSYGFQRGRSVWDAIDRAREHRQLKNWALKTDITSFFDRIDRGLLLKSLGHRIRKSSIFPLLELVVSSEVSASSAKDKARLRQEGIRRGRGLRQGMPLSPLLANCVLRSFDRKAIAAGYSMVRYADDLVFFFKTRRECTAAEGQVRELLAELGHEIPNAGVENSKTQICAPQTPVEFLGIELVHTRLADGYVSRVPKATLNRIREDILSKGSLAQCMKDKMDIVDLARQLTSTRVGYSGHYRRAENWPQVSRAIREACRGTFYQVLSELLGAEAMQSLSAEGAQFLGLGLIDNQSD